MINDRLWKSLILFPRNKKQAETNVYELKLKNIEGFAGMLFLFSIKQNCRFPKTLSMTLNIN